MRKKLSLFLLTKTEKDLLTPLRLIIADLRIKYREMDLTEFSEEAINDLQKRDFADLCSKRDVDTAAALNLSAILTKNKWFSVWSIRLNKGGDLTGKDPSNPPWIYALSTSDKPDIQSDISIEENPAFYQLMCDDYRRNPDKKIFNINPEIFIYQTQQVLGLTTEYLYIDPDSLDALFTIREVFGGNIYKATVRRITSVDFPLDKINSGIWNLLEYEHLTFAMEKRGSKDQVNVSVSINFEALEDDVKINRMLEPYDKAVYLAIGALYKAGQTVVSPQTIYHAMGYSGNPNLNDIEKIDQAITKTMKAWITINNEDEISVYGVKNLCYEGPLLQGEKLQGVVINGGKTIYALHLHREPPLMSWARERKQITTFSLQLLQDSLSSTNTNIMIRYYLIERISHAKNGTGQKKILFATICEKACISTDKERRRLPEKVKRLLDHYKSVQGIKGYHMEKDGVRIDI